MLLSDNHDFVLDPDHLYCGPDVKYCMLKYKQKCISVKKESRRACILAMGCCTEKCVQMPCPGSDAQVLSVIRFQFQIQMLRC